MLKSFLAKAFLLLPFITAPALAEPQVWLAQKQQRQFILLGSIHAGQSSFYPLPQVFLDYWAEAKGLIVEANILQPADFSLNRDKPTNETLLNKQEKRQLREVATQTNLPYLSLLHSPPWLAAMQLQNAMATQAGLSAEQGIDITLLLRAEAENKAIFELESLQQQLAMMESLPDHGQSLLRTTLFDWQEMQTQLNCMLSAWQHGDHHQMQQLLEDSRYSDPTHHLLIDQRNDDWTAQLSESPAYKQGSFLVVVGAMHLIGPSGVPSLLRQKGFIVTQLSQSQSSACAPN
ncbi:TraB/GumN family protein [Photobacterium atrarenae]|uniref:TraB/GumN family protein n=1 Tax=Photobacterium atrarenae TaxID=865757 RepID=A0ABY5GHG1_9GAMM|nr:TraB/GumN family protein [Photobacterium atrarenae]UTV28368.1 TraB/GumN family protein [Photobacterium atrarenae]